MRGAGEEEEEEQEEVRPVSATWSRGNRIHQSLTLSCHLLQIRRITWSAAQPDRPAGLASKTKTGSQVAHSNNKH